jgi:deoxyribodipyrimidine photolyase
MKRWLSELREFDARNVHQLREAHPLDLLGYLNSIVDHNEQFHSARQRYEQMR